MKKCLIILGFVLTGNGILAQEIANLYAPEKTLSEQKLRSEVLQSPIMGNTMFTFDDRYKGVEGSPYYLNNWTSGKVISKSGDIYTDLVLGLDLEYDELQLLDEQRRIKVLDKRKINAFTLYDSLTYRDVRFEKLRIADGQSQYCKVLYRGETSLYHCLSKAFVEANFEGAYNTGNAYDEYVMKEALYLNQSGTLLAIKNNRKSVLKAFPDHAQQLKAYIKQNEIYFNSVEELVEVVRFYDGL